MLEKHQARLKQTLGLAATCDYVVDNLITSGMLAFLRALGRPILRGNKLDSQESVSLDGAHAAGWHDCLDAIENFKELFLMEKDLKVAPKADFGAKSTLLSRGDITEEELRKIKGV